MADAPAWSPVPRQGGHGSLHANCPNPRRVERPHWRQTGPGRFFDCTGCSSIRHVSLCRDSEGKLECICGLALAAASMPATFPRSW